MGGMTISDGRESSSSGPRYECGKSEGDPAVVRGSEGEATPQQRAPSVDGGGVPGRDGSRGTTASSAARSFLLPPSARFPHGRWCSQLPCSHECYDQSTRDRAVG